MRRYNFTISFAIWKTGNNFLSCLIVLAKMSSTVMNQSSETEYSCLVLDIRLKVFSFSLLNMMLAIWGLHIWPLLWWGNFLPFLVCWMFLSWKCFECQMPFLHVFDYHVIVMLRSVNVLYHLHGCFVFFHEMFSHKRWQKRGTGKENVLCWQVHRS